jgi:dTDP-4-amino-4,6-dideoxygalactose transaminase
MKTSNCKRRNPIPIEKQTKMVTVTRSDLPPLKNYAEYLKKIWASRCLTNDGEFVQLLQKELKGYLKVGDLALVSNGTLALHLALRACQLRDEVITTPFTFAATTNVILWEGLTPVFADIDPETFNIDPEEVERKITEKTSAILAVHVYGNPCYVEKLQEIACRHKLKLIYDAAHAFGVEYKDQSVLNFGDVSTLSFHATKVFTTIEGGAIICKDEKMLAKIKLLRNHGIKSEEEVVVPGTNAKMDEFKAAMGLCNLKTIDERIQQRKRLFEHYRQKLSQYVQFQRVIATKYNYAYMPVCFEDAEERDRAYSELVKNGIKPRKYFFPLTTNNDYFNKMDMVKLYNLEQAFDVSSRVLCLPLYPDLEIENVDKVVEIVKSVIRNTHPSS